VKGAGFPEYGFFQAFFAAEKGWAIARRSLRVMLEALSGKRPKGKYLGPTALMEHGWRVKTSPTHQMRYDINNVHLLMRYTFTGQVKYQNTQSWLLD